MNPTWKLATWTRSRYGARVTIEDATGYLVTVSSPCPALAWCEAWARYDAVSARRGTVTG